MVRLPELPVYEYVMSVFAAGGGYVCRRCSVSADDYRYEAIAYWYKAARPFRDARPQLAGAEVVSASAQHFWKMLQCKSQELISL